MKQNNLQKNADRFMGFADTYDEARPAVPYYPVKIIRKYLGKNPETVVDLGSGTGLSVLVWKENCGRVIGIEPSDDMMAIAKSKECENVLFRHGFGNNTGLEDECADVVVCSQSFHWMEPGSTLAEVNRILKPGGVFAVIDCDWPPVINSQAEREYMQLYEKVRKYEKELPDVNDTFVRYSKDKHLVNIKNSGYFIYSREIVFSNTENCTAQRLINLILSQGSVQVVMKLHPELINENIESFKKNIQDIFGDSKFEIDFSYRMRIGVKRADNK